MLDPDSLSDCAASGTLFGVTGVGIDLGGIAEAPHALRTLREHPDAHSIDVSAVFADDEGGFGAIDGDGAAGVGSGSRVGEFFFRRLPRETGDIPQTVASCPPGPAVSAGPAGPEEEPSAPGRYGPVGEHASAVSGFVAGPAQREPPW